MSESGVKQVIEVGAKIQVAQYQSLEIKVGREVVIADDSRPVGTHIRELTEEIGTQVYDNMQQFIMVAAAVPNLISERAESRLATLSPAFYWLKQCCPNLANKLVESVLEANKNAYPKSS